MLGDSFSDAAAALMQAIKYYKEEFDSMPIHLRKQCIETIQQVDLTRVEIDKHQSDN